MLIIIVECNWEFWYVLVFYFFATTIVALSDDEGLSGLKSCDFVKYQSALVVEIQYK